MNRLLLILTMLFVISAANAEIMVKTTASTLNVRSQPSLSAGTVVYSLPKGSVASVVEQHDQWVKVFFLIRETPSVVKQGWISSTYIQILE